MIITFTTEDGTRTGVVVDCPRLPEINADGLYIIVREHGEFLGATVIDSSTGLYEVQARVEQMKSNDPEHLSHGRSVDASLVEKGAYVWVHGGWSQVDYWKHETNGSVQLNRTWFSAGERVLVHTAPELVSQEQWLLKQAVTDNLHGKPMNKYPARIMRKLKALQDYKAPAGTRGHSNPPKHRTPSV